MPGELISGFDQEAAAVITARLATFKMETVRSLNCSVGLALSHTLSHLHMCMQCTERRGPLTCQPSSLCNRFNTAGNGVGLVGFLRNTMCEQGLTSRA